MGAADAVRLMCNKCFYPVPREDWTANAGLCDGCLKEDGGSVSPETQALMKKTDDQMMAHISDAKAQPAPDKRSTRKDKPVCTGVLDYFPDAILAVAELSKVGNDQHNPGEPLHWSRSKSSDHADCLVRHQLTRFQHDSDGVLHMTKVAWRALAQLQVHLETLKEQS